MQEIYVLLIIYSDSVSLNMEDVSLKLASSLFLGDRMPVLKSQNWNRFHIFICWISTCLFSLYSIKIKNWSEQKIRLKYILKFGWNHVWNSKMYYKFRCRLNFRILCNKKKKYYKKRKATNKNDKRRIRRNNNLRIYPLLFTDQNSRICWSTRK